MKPTLNDVRRKIRRDPKWGFLSEMLKETDLDDQPTSGVVNGALLINTAMAAAMSTDVLVRRVRSEFAAEVNT